MKKLRKKITNNNFRFIMLLLVIMLIQAIRYYPFKFGGWNQIMLSFSYRYGFIQRAFIGTILDLVSSFFYIPLKYMRYIYGIFTVAFWSIICLFVSSRLLKNQKESEIIIFLKGILIAFFLGPGWVSFYSNFGITDTWLALISIFSVYLIVTEKLIYLSVIFSIIAELIHPGYVFLYFNLVMVIIAYRALFGENKKIEKKYVFLFILNAIVASIFFFGLFLFAHEREGITIDYVMERTAEFVGKTVSEIENHRPTISGFLFREGEETGIRCLIQSWGLLIVGMGIVFFPFFYEIYRYWSMVYSTAKQKKEKKSYFFALIPFGVVTLIPVYIMQNDYGRWTHAGLIYEVGIILVLLFLKDDNVAEGARKYMQYVRYHKWYYVFLIAYAGISGAFEQNLINSMVSTIEQMMWKIIFCFS